jgi:phosphatidylserine/phosphatidylglycerophosphate/cardiolipin synthase-like enzyme
MGSMFFDRRDITDVVLRRLADSSFFEAVVLVDKETFESKQCYGMRPRLDSMRRAGAEIVLCRGPGRLGRFHAKAAVMDRRYCYTGGANFTMKSDQNCELLLRMVGPAVADIILLLETAKAASRTCDGS